MLVITDVRREPPVKGDLFAGRRFWIAQRCPSRADFVKRVTYNGGQVVPLEKNADYLIVDHVRKDLPPGGISYRFIEKSIENEALQDPADPLYACGPSVGSVREVASTQGARRSKNPFTHQDDVDLYGWVKDCEARGAPISGNEIYKDLERRNNRHSWQSWRDHYIKILRHKPPRTVSANPPPSPPSDPQPTQSSHQGENANKPAKEPVAIKPSPKGKQRRVSPSPPTAPSPTYEPKEPAPAPADEPLSEKAVFTLKDFDRLLENAESAMEVPDTRLKDAWEAWADIYQSHSAEEWYEYFDARVRPIHEDLVVHEERKDIYYEARDAWGEVHKDDAAADDWLAHYREAVLSNFPPSEPGKVNEGPETRKELHDEENQDSDGHRDGQEELLAETNGTAAELATYSREQIAAAADLVTAGEAPQETPEAIALGKRRREDISPEQDGAGATPPPKRRNTDVEVSFASVQESIEVSPTKKSLDSPARHNQEILSITSSHPPSPSLPPDRPTPETQVKNGSPPEITIYEENDEEADSQASELRIRAALDGLDDEQMVDLLLTLRALPAAPDEEDDMTLQDLVVMHTVYFLKQIKSKESQAVWDVGDKLDQFGVMKKLFADEDEDSSDDGQGQKAEQDVWQEVIEAEAKTEGHSQDTHNPSDAIEEQSYKSPPRDERATHQQLLSATKTPHQHPITTLPPPQKQHPRPASSSAGTAITSFEMTIESTFDLNTEAQAEAYISSRLAPPYNFQEEHIVVALHATCANSTAMADAVLRWMRLSSASGAKKGRRSSVGTAVLPDEPGVWTNEDDRALRERGLAGRQKVERKHGRERCRRRREFLAEL